MLLGFTFGLSGGGMSDKRKSCAVPGCKAPMHARGYCRRHYSQLWRGRRSSPSGDTRGTPKLEHVHDDPERIRALERELNIHRDGARADARPVGRN